MRRFLWVELLISAFYIFDTCSMGFLKDLSIPWIGLVDGNFLGTTFLVLSSVYVGSAVEVLGVAVLLDSVRKRGFLGSRATLAA